MKKTVNSAKKRKIKKIIGSGFFILLVAFGVWFASIKVTQVSNSDIAYDFTIPYKKRNLSNYITVSCMVVMSDKDVIISDVKRPVSKIFCSIGDYVKKGDTLCEFSSETLDEQKELYGDMRDKATSLEALQKDYNAVSMSLARQQSDIGVSMAEKNRDYALDAYNTAQSRASEYRTMAENSENEMKKRLFQGISDMYNEQVSDLKSAYDSAQQYCTDAAYEAEKFKNMLNSNDYINSFDKSTAEEFINTIKKLDEESSKSVIKASRDGIISEIYVTEGDFAYGGRLFGIGDINKYVVKAFLKPQNIINVKVGDDVQFTTKLTGNEVINGKINSVSQAYTEKGYAVEIEITDEETEKNLRPNINAVVDIFSIHTDDRFAVQYDSIIEENGEKFVFRAVQNGTKYTAEKVKVQTGIESEFYIEITGSDLQENDMILGNAEKYTDGQSLRIRG